ncbi:MAG TPA: response regulator [Abditibacteriaceae bacterium]|jgi:CheY-like chemotaxis protein
MAGERILIVEDNPVNMELATDLLEIAGYTVFQAFNAECGIETACREVPDLILMDVGLPGMDGLEAAAILRRDAATSHVDIVVVTAHAMQGDQEKALAIGCAGYITKPIDTRSFTQTVAVFLNSPKGAAHECS